MNVLVVGATGHFAGLVVPELKKRQVTVTALVRTEEKGQTALKNGADKFVIGDLTDESSLTKAARGVDGVFHIIPAFIDNAAQVGTNMVTAAEKAGVKKFVFSSVYHPSLPLINHQSKQPTERALYQSKMDYTVLQPAMFMQILSGAIQSAQKSGSVTGAYSKFSKMSYVDYRDVAEVAAIAMVDGRLSYGTYELAASGMYDRVRLADTLSGAIGKKIEVEETTPAEWLSTAKMPDGPTKDGFFKMDEEYDNYGFSGGNSLILESILQRKPTSLEEFVEQAVRRQEAVPA